jgi:hypothetical protein
LVADLVAREMLSRKEGEVNRNIEEIKGEVDAIPPY